MELAKARAKLVVGSKLDPKDELEERLDACVNILKSITKGLSDREANDAVMTYVVKGQAQHDEVQCALLYTLLTSTVDAKKNFRDLMMTSKDGLTKLLTITNQIIYEKWSKLTDLSRKQMLWFAQELVRSNAGGVDSVLHMLLRQMAGGDVSSKNIWLTESLLDIFSEHRIWLEKFPVLMQLAVYSYLRVIVDHLSPQLKELRQREVEFCTTLLREKFEICQGIGRDLIRLMQDVARIPEFGPIWRDLMTAPEKLSANYKGIQQLLQTRTSKRFFMCRLTPDMENKLVFLTAKVKFGQQKRYQEWFQKQYLSTPESQSLRCDLIRYICAVIHPSNEILNSDVIPRWAVIGWLLTTCTTNVIASNAKLALFYDWLFFDPQKDSIMNIEPCILVMFHSIRPHPAITVTLLDFMCRIMPNFYPPLKEEVKKGIFTSLRTIIEKKVLASLAPLFDNAKIDRDLRSMIKENFSEFCASDVKEEPGGGNANISTKPPVREESIEGTEVNYFSVNNFTQESAQFSDDDEELTIHLKNQETVEVEKKETVFRPIKEHVEVPTADISDYVEQLDGPFKRAVTLLQQEKSGNVERQCELMDRLMARVLEGDLEPEGAANMAQCLVQILAGSFNAPLFPQQIDEESLEDSISTPLFVIFRTLCQMSTDDPFREPVLILLEEMYNLQPKLGYFFLYFLKISKTQTEGKMGPYKELVKTMERSMQECLMKDLKLCQEHDVRLFTFLIPDIYNQFPVVAVGHTELLHLIVSCIDAAQLQDLICEILRGQLVMFKKDSFTSVLNASLEWETIEQFFMWQLIAAHSIPVEHLMHIVPKLEFTAHSEALSSIMIQLRLERPTVELLRPLLSRDGKSNDLFTVSVLKYWAQEYEDRLAELLHTFISKPSQVTPNRKRQRHQPPSGKNKEKDQPTLEQILGHLEQFRATCKNISFLQHDQIQQALQHVQLNSADSFKTKFSDLLALAEDIDDLPTARVLRSVPSRKASAAAARQKGHASKGKGDHSDYSETSSEDEDISKPKSKKAKRSNLLDDDD